MRGEMKLYGYILYCVLCNIIMSTYRIIKTIYNGNDGPVFLIEDKVTKRNMVLKRYEWDNDKRGIDPTLLMECTILNAVKGHPNLLQMNRIEHSNPNHTDLIVELMDGELKKVILAEPNIQQIKSIMKQILNGLSFLHSNGIIHNDIKPKNILYIDNLGAGKKIKNDQYRYKVKIIDFGLAYLINYPYYRARKIQTTHHYTPPEYIDHREIGRISVNSDIFSLGIIFYYLLNPGTKYLSGYTQTDLRKDYDYIFDVNIINWDAVRQVAGKHGEDLLRQMLELNPDDRISSSRALQHPFIKDCCNGDRPKISRSPGRSRKGSRKGSRKNSRKGGKNKNDKNDKKKGNDQDGGSHRRWEVANLASKKEYINQRNHEEFLGPIVERCKRTYAKNNIKPKQVVPIHIWNDMYEYLEQFNLKFITLNYAIYLLLSYATVHNVRPDEWEMIAYTSIYLSSKLNEYEHDISLRNWDRKQRSKILQFEKLILNVFDWSLPLPIMITKEVILYDMYMGIIYGKSSYLNLSDLDKIGHFYNNYYVIELISSLTYFSPDFFHVNKLELIKVILSYNFKDIKHSHKLKDILNNFILSKQSLYWVGRDLINVIM